MSRIGKTAIVLPEKVEAAISAEGLVKIKGPKGELEFQLPKEIAAKAEDGAITFDRDGDTKRVRALHGLARALVNNMVVGVSEGFVKKLEIQGVGFRAAVKGSNLDLSLGKSHPILKPIPKELSVKVDGNTNITVEGIDKQLVGQFAADVRAYYPPEPYKGKGVRYVGEYVRRKAGKSVK